MLFIYLKVYSDNTEPFRKKSDGSQVFSLFRLTIGSRCNYSKMISFWGMKVLSIVKAHVSRYSPKCCLSVAIVAGASLVLILQASDWATVSSPARHYFQNISLLHISTRIPCSMLSHALVSSQLVGKCPTLTYIKSLDMLGCQAIALPST